MHGQIGRAEQNKSTKVHCKTSFEDHWKKAYNIYIFKTSPRSISK